MVSVSHEHKARTRGLPARRWKYRGKERATLIAQHDHSGNHRTNQRRALCILHNNF